MDTGCNGCVYYSGYYRENKCCNYIFRTGHSRPCPPGKDCTARKPRRTAGAKPIENNVKKSGADPQKKEDL